VNCDTPSIFVIIPTFNQECYLPSHSCRELTFLLRSRDGVNTEVIVDNGSVDACRSRKREPRLLGRRTARLFDPAVDFFTVPTIRFEVSGEVWRYECRPRAASSWAPHATMVDNFGQ
jgi:hypothetical protein